MDDHQEQAGEGPPNERSPEEPVLRGAFDNDETVTQIWFGDEYQSEISPEVHEHSARGDVTTEPHTGEKREGSDGDAYTDDASQSRKRPKPDHSNQTEQEREDAKLEYLEKGFKRENRRLWEKAWENAVVVDVNLLDYFTDGKRNSLTFPKIEVDLGRYDGSQPYLVLSKDGYVLLASFPNYLKKPSHDHMYEALREFAPVADVKIKKGADRKSRDTVASYQRRNEKDEISGVYQLVLLWKAIGRQNKNHLPGPARDVIKNVVSFHSAMNLLEATKQINGRVDHMYETMDPDQHAHLVELREALKRKYPLFRALSSLDPTIFHGRSLIYNRATPQHVDAKDPPQNLTPVLTLGEYDEGWLHVPDLGLEIKYLPGTLVMLRGALLSHSVAYKGGQRISIAHFMHMYMFDEVGFAAPPLVKAARPIRSTSKGEGRRTK